MDLFRKCNKLGTDSLVKLLFYVAGILLIAGYLLMPLPVNAVGEEAGTGDSTEADDGYQPSEYRLADERINEWEDRVLLTAIDQLEYEGHVYYAYGDYVDELISYFTQKDMDLSKEEAEDAISQIQDPNNARAGAQSGYLYQIGGKPKDSDSLIEDGEYDGKVYPEFDESVRFRNEEEYKASDLYLNNKAYIEERTNSVYESQAAMREEMRKLSEADREYQKILASRPANAELTEITASTSLGLTFLIIAAILLIATFAIIIYGWRNGTITLTLGLDDENWNRSNTHAQRHRIRKISAAILIVIVAFDIFVVYEGLTLHSTLGSNNYIEEAMDEGGICQNGYMRFREDVHAFLGKNKLPQNTLDLALTYRDYRFDYIKGTRSAMKNGSDEVVYKGIQESVEAQIDLMAYVTKQDSGAVVSGINDLYEDSLSTSIGVFINKLRSSLRGHYIAGYIISIVGLLLAVAMMVVERHDIYKGIKDIAIGAVAGTALWAVNTAYFALAFDKTGIGLADDSVYVMFTNAMKGMTPFMLILLSISAVISVLLFLTSVLMRRNS